MKNRYLLLFALWISACRELSAQCSSCTPSFGTCLPTGGICNRLDTAYANNPYNKTLNFYMPPILTSASILSECSCSEVELQSIQVTGVSGLPTGVNYLVTNGGYFNVQGGDTLGCAQFCGTPLAAGIYPVTVYLSADVLAIGTPIGDVNKNNVAQSYNDTLFVLPDTVAGVSSFTYGNNGFVACDSITVTLNALLSAPQPNVTTYSWNVAGQTSQVQSPGLYTFTNYSGSQPDTFPIILTTVFYDYSVSSAYIYHITGGYCGDIFSGYCYLTCICVSCADEPDPYISFPTLGYASAPGSCVCSNIDYTNINQSIPVGTQAIPVQIWAAATDELCDVQLLGTDTVAVLLGQSPWSDNNTDGYVEFDTVPGTTISDTLYVIVNPSPPVPVITGTDTFCSGDSLILSADSGLPYQGNFSYQWFNDSVLVAGVSDSAFYASQPGGYKVIVSNENTGCSSISTVKQVTMEQFPETPAIVFTGTGEFLNPFSSSGFTANWYYNGALVPQQNGQNLPFLGNGIYSAVVFNSAFPACSVEAAADTVYTGIETVPAQIYDVELSPNPNNGKFNLRFSTETQQPINIRVQNTIGQMIYTRQVDNIAGRFNKEVDLGQISRGVYFVTVESSKGSVNKKVIIE